MYFILLTGFVAAAYCNVIPEAGSEFLHKRVKRSQYPLTSKTVTLAPLKFKCEGDMCVEGCKDDAGKSYTPNHGKPFILTTSSGCYTCDCVPPANLGEKDMSSCKLNYCAVLGDCKKIVKIPNSCCSKCEDGISFGIKPAFTFPPFPFRDEENY